MNLIKLMLVMALIIVGLCNRRHAKPHYESPPRTSVVTNAGKPAPVNPELLKNAERLAETLRRCNQTAHNNRETQ